MSSLLTSKCETWIDEKGNSVTFVPTFCSGMFYIDQESRELRSVYSPYRFRHAEKMGSANIEEFASQICGFFPITGEFGGFEKDAVQKFAERYQNSDKPGRLRGEYLRIKWVKGKEVLFPTKTLIQVCFDEWER